MSNSTQKNETQKKERNLRAFNKQEEQEKFNQYKELLKHPQANQALIKEIEEITDFKAKLEIENARTKEEAEQLEELEVKQDNNADDNQDVTAATSASTESKATPDPRTSTGSTVEEQLKANLDPTSAETTVATQATHPAATQEILQVNNLLPTMAMSKTSVEIQKVLTAWDSLSKDQIKELITIQLTALTNLEDSLDLADTFKPTTAVVENNITTEIKASVSGFVKDLKDAIEAKVDEMIATGVEQQNNGTGAQATRQESNKIYKLDPNTPVFRNLLPDIPSSISQESFLSEITSSKDDEVNYFFITIRY
jgi:hypothetical protein